MALPLLENMIPNTTLAAKAGGTKPPVRMAFLFAPNGKHMADWTPKTEGPLDKLPKILKPLEPYKSDILLLSDLAITTAGTAGCGGHSCTVGQFLTGTLPKRTVGQDVKNGISVDQIAAKKIGHKTRFPSLELGCMPGQFFGDCDSGFSCIYTTHISWRTETSPLPKEINPRVVFDRLFGNNVNEDRSKSRLKRDRERKSILDLVAEDARSLQLKLGTADQRKLDEYLYTVRQVELGIENAAKLPVPGVKGPAFPRPAGVPTDIDEHVRLMLDLMVLAFQNDSTRIISFMFGNGSDNRGHPQVGVSEGHHNLSHHTGDKKKQAKLSKINRHYTRRLAYFLEKLKAIPEADGTLLDNSMILYGCAFGDGNAHDWKSLPILLAGKGGGAIKPGRHIRHQQYNAKDGEGTPLSNLYLSMLDNMGAPTDKLGDSTGRLDLNG
jgi:hypothetical protein